MKSGRILVVDDEEIVREVLETLLRGEDYAVDLAENGPQALARMRENDYAVVLVDSLRDAQEHAGQLVQSLEKVAALRPEFTLQAESIIGPIRAQLALLEQKLVVQG